MKTKEKKCYNGYLVRKLEPVVFMMPYIMPRFLHSGYLLPSVRSVNALSIRSGC